MLTPQYYQTDATSFRNEVDGFLTAARAVQFRSPFAAGVTYTTPSNGTFGAGKGPGGTGEHHPAVDLHAAGSATAVNMYAAHDGSVATFTTSTKYRHHIALTKEIKNGSGTVIGKLVTIYAHVDLDLDVAGGLSVNGSTVAQGDLISKNLYSGTAGGPHLHFEVRYYRSGNAGTEEFYGSYVAADRTAKSAGPWSYGYWNPGIGYGFGRTSRHSLPL